MRLAIPNDRVVSFSKVERAHPRRRHVMVSFKKERRCDATVNTAWEPRCHSAPDGQLRFTDVSEDIVATRLGTLSDFERRGREKRIVRVEMQL